MSYSSSRRSPPGTRRTGGATSTSNLDDTYGRVSTRPSTGGVVLESVQTFVNGKPVSTKTYTQPSTSHTTTRHHAPSRSQTTSTRQPESSSTAIARSSSTRHAESSSRTSRTNDAYSTTPTVATRRTVYAYPDRSARLAEPSSKHHTRRLSDDPRSRDPYPPERSSRTQDVSRDLPIQDTYSYTSAQDMYTDTEPKWRGTRRQGSVDAAGSRVRERPVSVYESFPPTARRERDNQGPPPTTRGLDKINAGGGIVRSGSLRDPSRDGHHRRSPERAQRRQNSYGSDEEFYSRPVKSATMPIRSRNDERDLYPPRDAYDDDRARRPSPADRGVASRGFGVLPGAGDYTGYAREEAPTALREPPIRGFQDADAVDPRNYMPNLPRDERRGDGPPGRTSRMPPPRDTDFDYADIRDQDPRDKPRHRRDEYDYERNARPRDYDSRYDQPRESNRAEERRPRDKRYERDDYDDDDYESRRNRPRDEGRSHRDDLVAGAEAALGAGAVAYGANAIHAEREETNRGSRRNGKEREPPRETGNDDGRGRDQDRREEQGSISPPQRPRDARSSPKAAASPPSPDSPDQPRRRHYVAGGDNASEMGSLQGSSPPAASFDLEEDYRRRVQQAAQQPPPQPPPANDSPSSELPRRTSREEPPAGDPRRYIPDSVTPTESSNTTQPTNPIYTHPENDPTLAVPPDPSRATSRVRIVEPPGPRSILRKPTASFPEDPNPERPGVAPLDKTKAPNPDARWTKISRDVVNPEALREAGERFEERDGYVVVLRVLDKREIQTLADMTRVLRDRRYQARHGSARQIEYDEGAVRS